MAGGADGWMRIQPFQSILLNVSDPEPGGQALRDWIEKIRGMVLARALWIELNIENAVCGFLFGKDESAERKFFSAEIFRSHSFDKKIAIAIKVAKLKVGPEKTSTISTSLRTFQALRNMMAHEPCWLEPVTAEGSDLVVSCRLLIAKGDAVWELTSEQAENWTANVDAAIRDAQFLNNEIHGLSNELDAPNGTSIIQVIGR